jgi:manganese/zinc/iron transport system permease protein
MVSLGGEGKSLFGLLLGGLVSGLLGMGLVLLIRRVTRLKEDAALGIVLSVTFGLGVALLGIVQRMRTGSAAGLESFIYGKTASMIAADAWLIAGASAAVILASVALFKEFNLVCFDQSYAASRGWPVVRIDVVMMSLAVAVTVIGLQSVGLILIIAILVIPPAAGRFWTDDLRRLALLSGVIGAAGGFVGAALSATTPRLPAGAVIVVVLGALFLLSLVFGTNRGILRRAVEDALFNRRVAMQNLLRSLYEYYDEVRGIDVARISSPRSIQCSVEEQLAYLTSVRAWSERQVLRLLDRASRRGLLERAESGAYCFTAKGISDALRIVRNHRLWETYLVTYADVAAANVHRDADAIEHVLGPDLVAELEQRLTQEAR